MEPTTPYPIALTWAPMPLYQKIVDPKDQFNEVFKIIKKLKYCIDCDKSRVYPELTEAGNVHFHAILYITDKIKWFKSILPTLKHHGFVCVKQCKKPEGWIKYITKEAYTMATILDLDSEALLNNGLNLKSKLPATIPLPEPRADIRQMLTSPTERETKLSSSEFTLIMET